ncbi:MAG: SusC/RagA family TonB-linked outer membrane protein, partial [Saprospiraceae bacterium]|nr:SusC/RagA family TonB-linked outer membrane protein [Saprospiraceae bacterium]
MRPIVTPYLKNYWLVPIFCLGFWNLILAQEQDSVVDTMVWDEHTTYDRGNFRDSTYSNAAAGKANVSMRQVNYTEQFLQGSVAGLVAIENSGQPGGSMSLQIRGAHTIGAGSQPLYIIDGIPIYQSVRQPSFATTFGPALGALSFLNPNDIASITVLKDAAATALYGARGSNGVIIIRTKRAEKSQSGIELKISGGLQQPIGEYKLANARQYASFLNEAQLNAGLPALYSNPDVFGAGTDWQEAIRREQAWSQHYHLGITGGGDKVSFLLSGQYLNQNGLAIGSDLQRYSIHANIDAQVNDRFTVQNSFNFARVESNTIPSASSADNQSQDVISGSMLFNPLLPLVNPDQSVNNHNVKVAEDGKPLSLLQSHFAQANPRLLGGITDSKLSFNQLSNYVSLNYAATEKLSMQTTIGLNAIFNDQFTFVPGQLFFGSAADAIGTAAKTQSLQFINEYKIAYTHNFVAQHQVIARVGFSTEGYRQEFLAGQSVGFDNESLRFYSLTVGQDKNLQSDLSEWGMQSYLGTIDYKYANRYALTLSLRSDASSFFSGAHSVFPAVSTHWDLSTTSFVKNSHFINKLAFRASYGETGNQSIAPYSSYTVLNEFNPALNGGTINGISLSRIGNNALDAERTNQLNGGLHLGFCNNRFLLDFDVYHHKTDNALVWQPLAGSSGFEDVLTNAANITNTGVEL